LYPALSVTGADRELVLAVADDHSPTAAEDVGDSLTLYFRDAGARDAARHAIAAAFPDAAVAAREIDDEDWARRSQENLQPITIGRLTVYPSLSLRPRAEPPAPDAISIVIQPSMGFGTGHHATTRLCLTALQHEELAGRTVLDIGSGSGILTIAAACLGAANAVGIDNDPDAIQAARENLSLNPGVGGVTFDVAELGSGEVRLKPDATKPPDAARPDVVLANLTGALLVREAGRILAAVKPGGRLILSGLLDVERDDVVAAFRPAAVLGESREGEWVALVLGPPNVLPRFPV
jgi:ribosomal protein L11 methyltransferase